MESFSERVYEIVEQIPKGRVTSYGAIAKRLGKPRGAREVGWAMKNCPESLPWQRVVMADGSIAGGGYAEMRRGLLEGEGVAFSGAFRGKARQCVLHPFQPRGNGRIFMR